MNAIRDRLHALRLAWDAARAAYHMGIYRAKRARRLPDLFL